MLKWIGGATVAVALVLTGVAIGGSAFAESDTAAETTAAEVTTTAKPEVQASAIHGAIAAKAAADQQAAFTVKRVLPITGPIKYGEWHWNEEGAPKDGPLLVTVDLQARTISIFRDGYEIGAAAVMLGTDDHPTPTGTFPILTKERHNVSEKYGNAPMPWTLRLTWDGIAIHGGNTVENGYASHGCVAIPDELASRLFDIAKKGDLVIITDGQRIGVGDPITTASS